MKKFQAAENLLDFDDIFMKDPTHPRHLINQGDGSRLSKDGLVKMTFTETGVAWSSRQTKDAPFVQSAQYVNEERIRTRMKDNDTESKIRARLAYNQAVGFVEPDVPLLTMDDLTDPNNPRYANRVDDDRWFAGDGSWSLEVEWDDGGPGVHATIIEDGEEIEVEDLDVDTDTRFNSSFGFPTSTVDVASIEAQIRDEIERRQIARRLLTASA